MINHAKNLKIEKICITMNQKSRSHRGSNDKLYKYLNFSTENRILLINVKNV